MAGDRNPTYGLETMSASNKLQFRVSYSDVEDRILLSGSFVDGSELSLWLTRRLTFGLTDLAKSFVTQTSKTENPELRDRMVDFERDAATRVADRKTPYEGGTPHQDLGSQPLLVNRLTIKPESGEQGERVTLQFGVIDGRMISFPIPRQTFLAIWNMIEELIRTRTGWLEAPRHISEGDAPQAETSVVH